MDKLKHEDYDYVLPKEHPLPRYFGIKPDYDFIAFDSKNDEESDIISLV